MLLMFKEFLIEYKAGETEAKELFAKCGYVVKDVSSNSNYFDKDIDLIVTNTTGITKTIEVKADNRIADTGNLFIEYLNPRSKGGLGWFRFCQADLLYYADMTNKLFYVFDYKALKAFVEEHKSELKTISTYDRSVGFALPIAAVEHIAKVVNF